MNPTPVTPATLNATTAPPRWISWIWSVILALAMSPAAFAQNDKLTIEYSGDLKIGCSLVLIVSSKCKDMFVEPDVTVDGKKVVMIEGDRGWVVEVLLDKTGPLEIKAQNTCKKTEKTLQIKNVTFTQSLSFRDPQAINLLAREISRITVTATWDGRENILEWRMFPQPITGSKAVATCGYTDSVKLGWRESAYVPGKAQLNPNTQYYTGWARWVEMSWYIDCASGSLIVNQPFISP